MTLEVGQDSWPEVSAIRLVGKRMNDTGCQKEPGGGSSFVQRTKPHNLEKGSSWLSLCPTHREYRGVCMGWWLEIPVRRSQRSSSRNFHVEVKPVLFSAVSSNPHVSSWSVQPSRLAIPCQKRLSSPLRTVGEKGKLCSKYNHHFAGLLYLDGPLMHSLAVYRI